MPPSSALAEIWSAGARLKSRARRMRRAIPTAAAFRRRVTTDALPWECSGGQPAQPEGAQHGQMTERHLWYPVRTGQGTAEADPPQNPPRQGFDGEEGCERMRDERGRPLALREVGESARQTAAGTRDVEEAPREAEGAGRVR